MFDVCRHKFTYGRVKIVDKFGNLFGWDLCCFVESVEELFFNLPPKQVHNIIPQYKGTLLVQISFMVFLQQEEPPFCFVDRSFPPSITHERRDVRTKQICLLTPRHEFSVYFSSRAYRGQRTQ